MAYSTKALYLLLISLLLLTSSFAHDDDDYKCHHDEIEQDPQYADIEEDRTSIQDGRRLESSDYPNLRIYAYFDFLEENTPSSFASYIQNELVPPVLSYLQSALRVKYPVVGKLKLGSNVNKICERAPPSILRNEGVDADLFMYYDTYATEKFIAYAAACYMASGTKRPIAARTMINRNRFSDAKGDPLVHERNVYTILHETIHSLGFSTYYYPNFLDENGNRRTGHVKKVSISGRTRTVVDVPPLTQKLRDFYGCSSLQGAIMENDGGSGTADSHFETRYFMHEVMVSSSSFGRKVSEFTLALLEGSGWYVPDYSYAEPFFFGKGQGCSFMSDSCSSSNPKFDDYCGGSSRGCTPMGRGGGSCSTSDIMDGCKSYKPTDAYDCDNDDGYDNTRMPDLQVYGRGAGSKCFMGDLNTRKSSNGRTSFCFKYNCIGSGSDTQLEVQIGKNTITCTEEGTKTIDGYYGSIDCPDPLAFCETVGKKYCPLNCSGKGSCVNNKCQCDDGWTGVDCAMRQ